MKLIKNLPTFTLDKNNFSFLTSKSPEWIIITTIKNIVFEVVITNSKINEIPNI